MDYSEKELKNLAKSNPKELIRILLSPSTPIHTLTFGIEILGTEVSDESIILQPIRMLLKHINAVVREGAIIGMLGFYNQANKKPPKDIIDRIKFISQHDPSPTLKQVATDTLTEIQNLDI